jgi:hypothetical protein
MSGDITTHYSSRSDLHRHEDIQTLEGQRDWDEDITGDNHFSLLPNERSPFGQDWQDLLAKQTYPYDSKGPKCLPSALDFKLLK